ncbi:MAG TPA: hypothetical protein VFY29_19790 [Terriglobia bacterium]|nr:hypothetical protein [Terriglobia bacterium]
MRRFLLWSFERGSPQYDVICAIILSFIFLTPETVFNDRPCYLRVPAASDVRECRDDYGRTVYTVRIETPLFASEERRLEDAEQHLHKAVEGSYAVSKTQPIYDTWGVHQGYAIWIQR